VTAATMPGPLERPREFADNVYLMAHDKNSGKSHVAAPLTDLVMGAALIGEQAVQPAPGGQRLAQQLPASRVGQQVKAHQTRLPGGRLPVDVTAGATSAGGPRDVQREVITPKAGDVLLIDDEASVQFAGLRCLIFRVAKVREGATYRGWVWLKGYAIDRDGCAVEQREIFVQLKGLKRYRLPAAGKPADGPTRPATDNQVSLRRRP
jgi:hypothetical protein